MSKQNISNSHTSEEENPCDVQVELVIRSEGISATLSTESQSDSPTVLDEAWITTAEIEHKQATEGENRIVLQC